MRQLKPFMLPALVSAVLLAAPLRAADQPPLALELVDVQKVWDRADHNAFTDLIRFRGKWYLAFREGPVHGVPGPGQTGGKLRLLRSDDGRQWESASLLDYGPGQDLRDPKLAITPADRLMLLTAAAPQGAPSERQSLVWFSDDGKTWSEPQPVGERNWWLWRVRAREKISWTNGRGPRAAGRSRRRGPRGHGAGRLHAVDVQGTGQAAGRPQLPRTAGRPAHRRGRLYDGRTRMALCRLDPERGALAELLTLPSGGDTSYRGLVWHDGLLWVSYYSSHEGKSCIYLARVRILPAPESLSPRR